MFKYLIKIQPLGLMYGSTGGFLSPENLVGRSGEKFPPEAATLSGLILSAHKSKPDVLEDLRYNLHLAGPFWAKCEKPGDEQFFYVPMPRHKIIGENEAEFDEFQLKSGKWQLASEADNSEQQRDAESEEEREVKKVEPEYFWLRIDYWDESPAEIAYAKDDGSVAKQPWKFVSILHPKIQTGQRNVMGEDGLFLEYAVQMEDDTCLIYLSTHKLKPGWYQFGGENHIVEISSVKISESNPILGYLKNPIQRYCALITPGVWGSNKLSYRYPKHPDFPKHKRPRMLTEKAVPYRYRMGHGETVHQERKTGRLSIGRYAVPAGSVYVFHKPLDKNWWNFPDDWFPDARSPEKAKLPDRTGWSEKNSVLLSFWWKWYLAIQMMNAEKLDLWWISLAYHLISERVKNSLLKKMGCGLCLPIEL